MSLQVKVILLLVAMVSISAAQLHRSANGCLCQTLESNFSGIRDIQLFKESEFCDRMEIIATDNKGRRFCLNPDDKKVFQGIKNILKRKRRQTLAATDASA